jgi:uncharacterized UPF0160 family protein
MEHNFKMENKKKVTIVTHSSKFHTDDIFAVATLLLVLEKDHEIVVVRSRDRKIIDAADYVVDVGDEYNADRNRFDHHQEGRAGERKNGIPYASFGLVWKKYGEELSGSESVAEKIDKKLVQPTDASDNGIQIFETKIEGVSPYTLDTLRRAFVPTWKEGFKDIDSIFMELVGDAKTVLQREIKKAKDDSEAGSAVLRAYEKSDDKRLIVFDRYYPADDFLNRYSEPLFTIFPSTDEDTWLLTAVQDSKESQINRKDLPSAWAGKSGEELEKITGVPGSVFCHVNLFLAVAKTKEAALKLAEIALSV